MDIRVFLKSSLKKKKRRKKSVERDTISRANRYRVPIVAFTSYQIRQTLEMN